MSLWAEDSLAQGDHEPIETLLAGLADDPLSRELGRVLLRKCSSDAALEYLACTPHLSDTLVADTLSRLNRNPWAPDPRRLTAAALHHHPDLYDQAFTPRTGLNPDHSASDLRIIAAAAGSAAAANHPGWSTILDHPAQGTADPWIRERLLLLANPYTSASTISLAGNSADPDVIARHRWRLETHTRAVTDWSEPASKDVHAWLIGTLTGTHTQTTAHSGHPAQGAQLANRSPTLLEPGWHQHLGELLANPHLDPAPQQADALLSVLTPEHLYRDRPDLFPELSPTINAYLERTNTTAPRVSPTHWGTPTRPHSTSHSATRGTTDYGGHGAITSPTPWPPKTPHHNAGSKSCTDWHNRVHTQASSSWTTPHPC